MLNTWLNLLNLDLCLWIKNNYIYLWVNENDKCLNPGSSICMYKLAHCHQQQNRTNPIVRHESEGARVLGDTRTAN